MILQLPGNRREKGKRKREREEMERRGKRKRKRYRKPIRMLEQRLKRANRSLREDSNTFDMVPSEKQWCDAAELDHTGCSVLTSVSFSSPLVT